MNLEANLQWWLAVTRVIESQSPATQKVFRMRLEGKSPDECRAALIADGEKNVTRERVRLMENRAKQLIRESMTPPITHTQGSTPCGH